MSDVVKVSIELADKQAQAAFNEFINKSDKSAKSLKDLKDTSESTFNEISVGIGKSIGIYEIFAGNIASNLVLGAFDAMKNAASSLFNTFVVEGVKAAQESETSLNALNVALAQSGNYSAEASADFQAFAKQIQATTAFEDDAIIKNAALIESLTQLDQKGLQRATSAAINLSAALGKDLETTSQAVAKAANGNVTALQKLGFEFQKGATDSETFANAMKAVEEKIGDRAAAQVNTYAGAVAQAGNTFGDLQEEIGNLIVQNPAVIQAIGAVAAVFRDAGSVLNSNQSTIKTFIAQGLIVLIDTTKLVVDTFNLLYKSAQTVWPGILGIVLESMAAMVAPFTLFSDTATQVWKDLKGGAAEAFKDVVSKFDENGMDEISLKLAGIGAAAEDGFIQMGAAATFSSDKLENNKTKTIELTEETLRAIEANKQFTESLAKTEGESVYEANLENIRVMYEQRGIIQAEAETIEYSEKLAREETYYAQRQTLLDAKYAEDLVRIKNSTASSDAKHAAEIALESKYNTNSLKLKKELDTNERKLATEQAAFEKQVHDHKLSATSSIFGSLSKLSAQGGKDQFEATKAFALAEAATSGYLAVSRALAAPPGPPWNTPGVIAAGLAAAVQVAGIASSRPPAFAQGGIVPGNMFSGDNVTARLNSGEMVINKRQQSNLFNMVDTGNGGNNSGGLSEKVDRLIEAILSQPISISVDGKELFNVFRGELARGRTF